MAHRRSARIGSWWKNVPKVVKEIVTLATALIGLFVALVGAGVIGGGEDAASTEPELPVVVRFESSNPEYSERGFFTPSGLIISTQYSLVSDMRVVWRSSTGNEEATVEVVERGTEVAPGAVLLELVTEEPPRRTYATRNAQSLEVGDEVRAYVGTEQETPGEVLETGATRNVPSYGPVNNLVVATGLGVEGEGGAPLLDAEDKVVGMLFAGSAERALAIPIEDLRSEFPTAFPP